MSGGRQKDNIWIHFVESKTIGKSGSRAKCKRCDKELQGIPLRMKAHYDQCIQSQSTAIASTDLETSVLEGSLDMDKENRGLWSSHPTKKRRSSSINEFVISTSKARKEELDGLLAEVIAACKLPFVFTEHESVKKFLDALRPGYKPPNRKQIAENLIPELYEKTKKKVQEDLKGKPVTFALDGWQNVNNDPLICAAIQMDNGESYLTAVIDSSGEQQLSRNLLKLGEYLLQTSY